MELIKGLLSEGDIIMLRQAHQDKTL